MPIQLGNFTPDNTQPDPNMIPPGTRAPIPGVPPPVSNSGVISEADALKGGDTAKLNTFSLSDPSRPNPGSNQVGIGSLLSGKDAVEMIDAVIPSLLVLLFQTLKVVVKKSDMQLTAKEKDVLAPMVQKVMDMIMLNFNSPVTALCVTAAFIYGGKLVEHGGAAFIDRKMNGPKTQPVAPVKEPVPRPGARKNPEQAPVVSMTPDPIPEGAVPVTSSLRPWDENDLKKVVLKRRESKAKCIAWLNNNWERIGGVL